MGRVGGENTSWEILVSAQNAAEQQLLDMQFMRGQSGSYTLPDYQWTTEDGDEGGITPARIFVGIERMQGVFESKNHAVAVDAPGRGTLTGLFGIDTLIQMEMLVRDGTLGIPTGAQRLVSMSGPISIVSPGRRRQREINRVTLTQEIEFIEERMEGAGVGTGADAGVIFRFDASDPTNFILNGEPRLSLLAQALGYAPA